METVVYGGLVMVDVQYCPTSCPLLGPSGCTVACGKEEIECPEVGRREKDGRGGRQMFSDFNRKTVLGLSRAIPVINGGGF